MRWGACCSTRCRRRRTAAARSAHGSRTYTAWHCASIRRVSHHTRARSSTIARSIARMATRCSASGRCRPPRATRSSPHCAARCRTRRSRWSPRCCSRVSPRRRAAGAGSSRSWPRGARPARRSAPPCTWPTCSRPPRSIAPCSAPSAPRPGGSWSWAWWCSALRAPCGGEGSCDAGGTLRARPRSWLRRRTWCAISAVASRRRRAASASRYGCRGRPRSLPQPWRWCSPQRHWYAAPMNRTACRGPCPRRAPGRRSPHWQGCGYGVRTGRGPTGTPSCGSPRSRVSSCRRRAAGPSWASRPWPAPPPPSLPGAPWWKVASGSPSETLRDSAVRPTPAWYRCWSASGRLRPRCRLARRASSIPGGSPRRSRAMTIRPVSPRGRGRASHRRRSVWRRWTCRPRWWRRSSAHPRPVADRGSSGWSGARACTMCSCCRLPTARCSRSVSGHVPD